MFHTFYTSTDLIHTMDSKELSKNKGIIFYLCNEEISKDAMYGTRHVHPRILVIRAESPNHIRVVDGPA